MHLAIIMSYTHNMYTVYKYALMVHKQLHGPVAGIIYIYIYIAIQKLSQLIKSIKVTDGRLVATL